jgi:hypothetical protein
MPATARVGPLPATARVGPLPATALVGGLFTTKLPMPFFFFCGAIYSTAKIYILAIYIYIYSENAKLKNKKC